MPRADLFNGAPKEHTPSAPLRGDNTRDMFGEGAKGDPLAEIQAEVKRNNETSDAIAKEIGDTGSVRFERTDSTTGTKMTALVGPDMSKPGTFRVTRFDESGPYGHAEFSSMRDAVHDAVSNGYKRVGSGTNGDMSGGPSARDHLGAAERAKDAARNGKTGGRADTGDGGLFDGERPEQTRVPDSSPMSAVAQRMANAHNAFVEWAKEHAGLNDDQARAAFAELMRVKALKIDPVMGQFSFTDGRFADPDVVRRAAGVEAPREQARASDKLDGPERSTTDGKETASGIPEGLAGQHTAASTGLGIKLTKWFRSTGKPGTYQFREIGGSSLPEPAARALRAMEAATGRRIAKIRKLTREPTSPTELSHARVCSHCLSFGN